MPNVVVNEIFTSFQDYLNSEQDLREVGLKKLVFFECILIFLIMFL